MTHLRIGFKHFKLCGNIQFSGLFRRRHQKYGKISSMIIKTKTRPDTREDSRGWLGRGHDAKTVCYKKKILRLDRPLDQHGKV